MGRGGWVGSSNARGGEMVRCLGAMRQAKHWAPPCDTLCRCRRPPPRISPHTQHNLTHPNKHTSPYPAPHVEEGDERANDLPVLPLPHVCDLLGNGIRALGDLVHAGGAVAAPDVVGDGHAEL